MLLVFFSFHGLILVSILVSAVGTHSRIPHLKTPPAPRRLTLGTIFREILETLANRSFVALFVAALLGAVASGLSAALSFYFYTYFWEFSSTETGIITMGAFLSAGLGFVLAPIVTRAMGKKRGAMITGLVAFIGAPLPVLLRLIDVLPENGTPFIFWFVFSVQIIDLGLIICFQILFSSMIADLVEQAELKTGRRSEGVFFSTVTFVRKAVQGLGLMAAAVPGCGSAALRPERACRLARADRRDRHLRDGPRRRRLRGDERAGVRRDHVWRVWIRRAGGPCRPYA